MEALHNFAASHAHSPLGVIAFMLVVVSLVKRCQVPYTYSYRLYAVDPY